MLETVLATLALQAGYNSVMVLIGTALLGAAAGCVGVFALLRKRVLISDAVSHATLPGVALGFLVAVWLGLDGRSLPVLLTGAAVTGAFGVLAVQWIRDRTRLPEDAAIGTVLSVFFGAGVVLLSHIQTLSTGGQAGLDSFLLGQTAALSRGEAELIAAAAGVVALVTLVFLKELTALSFDPEHAAAQGWPVSRLDLLVMALLLAVVAIGLKTVGLILVVALVVVPPVAARFWTNRLPRMVLLAAAFGALSGYFGATASAVLPDLPAGGVIVLVAGCIFLVSLLFAPRRGVLADAIRQWRFRRALSRRRALAALAEGRTVDRRALGALRRAGLVDGSGPAASLTQDGARAAAEAQREQRLWDLYLTAYPADADLGQVARPPRDALPPDIVATLERQAGERQAGERQPGAAPC